MKLLCEKCGKKLDWVLDKDKADNVKCLCGNTMSKLIEGKKEV